MISTEGFQRDLAKYYSREKRDLPWRIPESSGRFDPYKILVSEVMLQQTQVSRVRQKYQQFLSIFPDIKSLAKADLSAVLKQWQGLGYNRRAQYLQAAAMQLAPVKTPWQREELTACKGIGPNTASAVLVYSYNQPEIFIETNIRSVYLHYFFNSTPDISDRQILPLLEQTLDRHNPRGFYWALMDLGTHIKKSHGNPNKASRHYKRQPRFAGSARQLRGEVLRQLANGPKTAAELKNSIADKRLPGILQVLEREGLMRRKTKTYHLG